jgi:dynein heavy chain 1
MLAEKVLNKMAKTDRLKYEQLITECVHQQLVIEKILKSKLTDTKDFNWLQFMRFYYNDSNSSS